jgi:hypothetical protein
MRNAFFHNPITSLLVLREEQSSTFIEYSLRSILLIPEEETMEITTIEDVHIKCSATVLKDQEVIISWETDNPAIMGFEISLGTAIGGWDLFSGQFGKDLREVRLPGLSHDLEPLYVEFRYIVPYLHSENEPVHESPKITQEYDRYEIRLLQETPLMISRV